MNSGASRLGAMLWLLVLTGTVKPQTPTEGFEPQLKPDGAEQRTYLRQPAEAAVAHPPSGVDTEVSLATPGSVFRDRLSSGGEGPPMAVLPPGRFEQGSPDHEMDRLEPEGPVREVHIRKVALGQREVTRGEFRAFVDATGFRTDAERNTAVPKLPGSHEGCFTHMGGSGFDWKADTDWREPGFAQGDDHPVVCVSWYDAQAYVEWLGRETGKPYRLPSESEQEYAIRAGTTSPWNWGNNGDAGCDQANFGDDTLKSRVPGWLLPTVGCQDGHAFTAPAGSLAANAFGLYDTSGNVGEWSQDCWNEGYEGAPSDGSAWQSGDCSFRLVRGGSWASRPLGRRSAIRYRDDPAARLTNTGFRLARDL